MNEHRSITGAAAAQTPRSAHLAGLLGHAQSALRRRDRNTVEQPVIDRATRDQGFLDRLECWGPELLEALTLYQPSPHPDENTQSDVGRRVLDLMLEAHRARRPSLARHDVGRLLRPDWFSRPDQIGYVCYTERFAATLAGVEKKIDYLQELGITYLHLMPLFDSRPGPDDGGYAVRDYRRVRPDLGTMDDLAHLADALHDQGISLTLDLVLNHVAREHAWARAAMRGVAPYSRYFWAYPDRRVPDDYESDLPEVFPDFAPGNFSWVPDFQLRHAKESGGVETTSGAWVWTTFNDYQWDLNWSNSDVFCEFLSIILAMANVGVDCLRLDAIAFLWKRLGTSCQNQPEVHQIVAALRAATRIVAPATIFKAEAIVAPEQLPAYLGQGRHAGKVSDLAYQNSLMVQAWSALATADSRLAQRALAAAPPKPVSTAWATYVRGHDDIGWAISDTDAAALGLSGGAHRDFLSQFYSGRFPDSFARGIVFQANPEANDARISGTLASLAGLEFARETGDAQHVDLALGRIFLLHALIYGYGGIPLLYMGDELGLCNDSSYLEDPALARDNRWIHRPYLPWAVADRRHDPRTVEGRIFAGLRHLGQVRASLPALHAAVESQPIDVGTGAVLGLLRRHPAGGVLTLYNVSASWQSVDLAVLQRLPDLGAGYWEQLSDFDPLSAGTPSGDRRMAALPPYAAWWLTPSPLTPLPRA